MTIGQFGSDSAMFKLPKGLTVRNISQRGLAAIGQFENERFELVITSDDANLVNYKLSEDSLQQFGNFYSAFLNVSYFPLRLLTTIGGIVAISGFLLYNLAYLLLHQEFAIYIHPKHQALT